MAVNNYRVILSLLLIITINSLFLVNCQYLYNEQIPVVEIAPEEDFYCMIPSVGLHGNVIDLTRQAIAGPRVIAGTIVRIACHHGFYVQDGTIASQCLENGQWSDYLGVCVSYNQKWPFSDGRYTAHYKQEMPTNNNNNNNNNVARKKLTDTASTTKTSKKKVGAVPTKEIREPSAINNDDAKHYYYQRNSSTNINECGISGEQGVSGAIAYKIFGGKAAPPHAYPWMARLQFWLLPNTAHYCGATLISNRWLLTSASCVMLRPIVKSRVLLSSYNRAFVGSNDGERVLEYKRVVPHPEYDKTKPYYFNYALLELNETVPTSDHIRPICLPDDANICDNTALSYSVDATTIDTCDHVVTAGWGLAATGWEWNYPNELRHVAMNYVSYRKCMPIAGELLPNEMCAGGIEGRDSCIGDSGGPLMCLQNNRYIVVGVTSSGTSAICGTEGKPGIYSRVCSVIKWIRQVVDDR